MIHDHSLAHFLLPRPHLPLLQVLSGGSSLLLPLRIVKGRIYHVLGFRERSRGEGNQQESKEEEGEHY